VGRTEFDSPDVDNEVLIDASKHYVKTGEFVMIKIIEATEFDLYGEPVYFLIDFNSYYEDAIL
jgi:ribosomal protein S12 methylthiotransferase